jgi:hypothetical protein
MARSEKYIELKNQDDYIRIPDLKEGFSYLIFGENSNVGIWLPANKSFLISRFKAGNNYLFEEFHCDIGIPHGTSKPLKEIERSPFDIDTLKSYDNFYKVEDLNKSSLEILDYLNRLSSENPLKEIVDANLKAEKVD